MPVQPVDYQKIFEESPLARLVISQEKKDHFCVERANKVAVQYFCPKIERDCLSLDGMNLADFLDVANTTNILQALSVCHDSRVPISIQVMPKTQSNIKVQSFLLSPITDDDGTILWVDMQARPPATEQASVERERDDAISMFTTVFDVSDVGFTVTDHHGRFVRINDKFTEMTGWEPIDLMGQELTKIIPIDQHKLAWDRHKSALSQKVKNFGEIRILQQDGNEMNVMVTSAIMELSNGRSFRITTVVDVTELKNIEHDLRRAKDEADEANKAKSAFLANMSHELRTPLNSIIGFSEIIKTEALGEIAQKPYIDYAKDIHNSGTRLLSVINEILGISKIEAGERNLNESVVKIPSLAQSCVDLMATKIEASSLTISNMIDADLPDVIAEELALKQIIMNVLSNAIKFTPEGGAITLSSDYSGDDLSISITDTGIGIDEADIVKALSPFGQVDASHARGNSGTGLGLTLVDSLMRMHGGSIDMVSQKGFGTTVTLFIPNHRVSVKKVKASSIDDQSKVANLSDYKK